MINLLHLPAVGELAVIIIPYTDVNISYKGRWLDSGIGMWSAFTGAACLFKVRNTTQVTVNAYCVDPNNSALCFLTYKLDNDPITPTSYYFTTAAEVYTGMKTLTIPMINDGQYHTLWLCVGGYFADNYAATSTCAITSFQLDAGANIAPWTTGAIKLQCIGDSWMATSNDWPRLMDNTRYSIYPVSAGGLTCAQMNTYYPNDYSGHVNTTDVSVDGILIGFGVNDFNASVTVADFQTAMLALVDKVQAKQAGKPIVMIRIPKNNGSGKDFGQYGTAMNNITGLRSNCYYCNTSSLDANVTWNTDTYHLENYGRVIYAAFIKAYIMSIGL